MLMYRTYTPFMCKRRAVVIYVAYVIYHHFTSIIRYGPRYLRSCELVAIIDSHVPDISQFDLTQSASNDFIDSRRRSMSECVLEIT